MAFEFKRLADVETLSEVPENATVLSEVNGAIKRIPSVGLGGGSGNIIVLVQDADSDSISPMISDYTHCTFTANMDFADAMAAFRSHEITGSVVYIPQESTNPTMLDSDSTSITAKNLDYAFISDGTSMFGVDCLVFITLQYETYIYWTADGISTEEPGGGSGEK